MRDEIPGTVVFLFQPAEEGPPAGEAGGAALMIKEGALDSPVPDAIFGLHTWPMERGYLGYRAGGTMAGADSLSITITGRQTHGAVPWGGIDPIVIAAQVVMGLQTITSRQIDPLSGASIVTIGSIHGGVRGNIIPDEVKMEGTIRVLQPSVRADLLARVERTVKLIAQSAGATAEVVIDPYAPVTYNDPELTRQMAPTLARVAPKAAVEIPAVTPSEDFAFFQEKVPGVYFFLGISPPGKANPAPNHSPLFFVDEEALPIGVRAMSSMAMDYLVNQ
jgi:amidohydrolase